MSDYLLSVLLGIIEGLTEFLPVSSTAHLRISEAMLTRLHLANISLDDPYWKMFSIVIQLGAILTLPIYFRQRIRSFLVTFPGGRKGEKNLLTHPLGLTAIAFTCTAVPSLLLTKLIGKNLESLTVMGTSLVVGGVVMWVVDAYYGKPRTITGRLRAAAGGETSSSESVAHYRTEDVEEMTLGQSVWIGCCQVASAVFPGTSRSMSTIAAGQIAGMSRPAALEFSFLLSIPTMVAATGYDLFKSMRHAHSGSAIGAAPHDVHGWMVLAIGFVVSFVVAYAVVAWFMNWVRTRGFVPFAVYRIIVGAAVLAWAIKA